MSVYVYLSLYLIFTDIGKLKKHEHLFYIFTTTEKKIYVIEQNCQL